MTIPIELQQQIVNVLKTLPNFHDPKARRALILSAGLDEAAKEQLEFNGATALFCQQLVNTLSQYGTLQDGRPALTAVLTGAIGLVGREGQAECQRLIAEIAALPLPAPPEIRRKRRARWFGVSLAILGAASVLSIWFLHSRSQPLAGAIQDQRGQPLSGVTVTLKEFPVEATTDQWGRFALRVKTPKQTTARMMFRKTGCEKSPQDVTLGNTALTVQMKCE